MQKITTECRAEFDVYAEDIPKYISKEMTFKNKEGALDDAEKKLKTY